MNRDPEGREWHRLDPLYGGWGQPLGSVQIGIDWNGDGQIDDSELHNITRPQSFSGPASYVAPPVYPAPVRSAPVHSAPVYSQQPQFDNYGNTIPENPNV